LDEAAGAADATACSRDGYFLSYKICVLSDNLGNLDNVAGALRAALLVDHLTTKYPDIFANLPRWRGTRIPADLGTNVVQALNKFIEEVQRALDNDSLVKSFLAGKTGTK